MFNQVTKKQIIFSIIYLTLFAFFGFLLYKLIVPKATCSDGKQNQSEKGIDCGGQCKPCKSNDQARELQIKEVNFVDAGDGTYDVEARISNPNYLLGLNSFTYEFVLKNETGDVIASRKAKSYILPADSKYLIEIGLRPEGNGKPKTVEIKMESDIWQELADVSNPQLEINNQRYEKDDRGFGGAVGGMIKNNSPYDLDFVNVAVIARDQYGKIVGLNVTTKDDVRAKEQRSFMVSWPAGFKAQVSKVEVEAQSNVYNLTEFSK